MSDSRREAIRRAAWRTADWLAQQTVQTAILQIVAILLSDSGGGPTC